MATQEDFDFDSFKKEAIAGLYAGKKMTDTDGVLAPMMKYFLESIYFEDTKMKVKTSKLGVVTSSGFFSGQDVNSSVLVFQ